MRMPNEVSEKLSEWFGFPDDDIFCQVATTDHLRPYVRTMRMNNIDEQGSFVLFAATTSKKWNHLQHNHHVAVSIFKDQKQILAEGPVKLHTYSSEPFLVQDYWDRLATVWQDFYNAKRTDHKIDDVPSTFGLIEVMPTLWETLAINPMNYLNSERIQFRLILNNWVRHEMIPG